MKTKIAVALAIFTLPAAAKTPVNASTVARNFVILSYAEARCPSLRMNMALVAKTMGEMGISAETLKAEAGKEIESSKEKLDATFGEMNERQFCELMEDMFGPSGTIAENFLKKR